MQKFILLLLGGVLGVSCVDKDYDLNDIDTDNVTIGDETSEFAIPLARVKVGMKELSDGGASGEVCDIEEIFDEADTWLPSPLPGNADYVDLTELSNDSAYADSLIEALSKQMMRDEEKLAAVTDRIWAEYREEFFEVLELPQDADETLFKETFRTMFRSNAAVREKAQEQARSYLTRIQVEPISYAIDDIGIGSDLVDMLTDNLGTPENPDPHHSLSLYGDITSDLPVGMRLDPEFQGTRVRFPGEIEPDRTNPIEETRLYADDLRTIVGGVVIEIPVELRKYYPGTDFDPSQQIVINLRLVKRGGLSFNL